MSKVYDGEITEFRYFDRALTANEIKQLYLETSLNESSESQDNQHTRHSSKD
jgi:hypothetical protein